MKTRHDACKYNFFILKPCDLSVMALRGLIHDVVPFEKGLEKISFERGNTVFFFRLLSLLVKLLI
jgi:hypothetical protein